MRTAILIGKIKEKQIEVAVGGCLVAQNQTEFGYGEMCGMVKGLEKALEIIKADAEEAKKEEGRFHG